ncbi:MAG: hypothetical protein ABMB14_07250, partial [Myxococcota bacterium]
PEPYEVVVYGELQVAKARQAVVQTLTELGYDAQVIDRGDHVVYRHEEPWHGEVVVYDDGWVQVERQPMRVEGRQMPWAARNSPGAWAGCVVWPWLCIRASGATFGHRKWMGLESRTVDAVAPKVRDFGDRVADLATTRKVDALPDRLIALWDDGRPLDPAAPTLATPADRRRALYTYWVSRTDTEWGHAVQDAVEAFCRAVVQTSDAPFTPAELAALAQDAPGAPGRTAFLAAPSPDEGADTP